MLFRSHPGVSPVGDREVRSRDESAQLPLAQQEDVIDDVVGRRDLPVAVVPCELDELQEIEGGICHGLAECADDTSPPACSSLRPTDCHQPSLAQNERLSS